MASEEEGSSNHNQRGMEESFLYKECATVPKDTTHVRVDPSVKIIPAKAFSHRRRLVQVELPHGLEEIGDAAFFQCRSLKKINIPTTVRVIHDCAFLNCVELTNVDLPEGLREIGDSAFNNCALEYIKIPTTISTLAKFTFYRCYQLRQIDIPSTLRVIGKFCFNSTSLSSIYLPDNIEIIGEGALRACHELANVRLPPNIRILPENLCLKCSILVSIELPEQLDRIDDAAFSYSPSLRNIAIPPEAYISEEHRIFKGCEDLRLCQNSEEDLINALKHRFDGLPIHKWCYYQSYHPPERALHHLNQALNLRTNQSRTLRLKLNPSGNQQDYLGMTPLHILACSNRQSLELYQMIFEKYPKNLITKDKWEGLPIFYAIWTGAPEDIIRFLAGCHASVFPDYRLNWDKMVDTLGLADVPTKLLQNLLDTQQNYFPGQNIDLVSLSTQHTKPIERYCDRRVECEMFKFLVLSSVAGRLNSIGIKHWRENVTSMIKSIPSDGPNNGRSGRSIPTNTRRNHLDRIRSRVAAYEHDYHQLKEAMSLLELAVWKARIDESKLIGNQRKTGKGNKKIKIDNPGFRLQCRVSCRAETIIENVLPYLTAPPILL